MRSSICEKIRKDALKLHKEGKPSYLLHVSKKVMLDVTYEFFGDGRPDTTEIELAWLPHPIVVKRLQYLEGKAMEWSDLTKEQYESWNKR